ncbi:MAG: NUDIX hydrolase [Lachnospiraceae bacterium]|jgi:ADP-ribose pyrophosphatase
MPQIHKVTQLTHNKHLNMYELEASSKTGRRVDYFVASRAKETSQLKLVTGENPPDGVIIYSLYGEHHDRVVLVKQYRYAIDSWIYEFPAGLVEPGEDYKEAAIRELKEETGLTLVPIETDAAYERPYFTTIGLTDESCGTVYGYAKGDVSREGLEDTEDLEIVLADREEIKRILKEEKVAIMCAYMLMHFLHEEDPFAFLKE